MTDHTVDFRVLNLGSLWRFEPISEDAKMWTDTMLNLESWQWLGDAFMVDHRPARQLCEALVDEGFTVG